MQKNLKNLQKIKLKKKLQKKFCKNKICKKYCKKFLFAKNKIYKKKKKSLARTKFAKKKVKKKLGYISSQCGGSDRNQLEVAVVLRRWLCRDRPSTKCFRRGREPLTGYNPLPTTKSPGIRSYRKNRHHIRTVASVPNSAQTGR